MKVTSVTRRVLAIRRETRRLLAQGYTKHETDWRIHRGCNLDHFILDVRISADRKHVWVKTGPG